ncbi:DeoR faimly transcriptional regulator [Stenotrophomonas ginsengisoli]|uniref:DeoR faimly transcriptional regulator n=1 Tax=Stenotrophomonas ginsengisoli TaxID=336566 RepID=A0A0R0DB35_9GAMM|nr:EAL domain-containing protein [Stenotrophomonas ginsengisoli]KRG78864.1 DeoR faimly transcriptional regulator [Stenotrophomonas ginsengisoli]
MRKMRFGLQARAIAVMGVSLLIAAIMVILWMARLGAFQTEVRTLGGELIGSLYEQEAQRRGISFAGDLALALVNPMYYSDSEQVAKLVNALEAQPLVSYVRVFDARGNLVHDGSETVADFGRRMDDPLADKALAATQMLLQRTEHVLEVTMPVLLGEQRLGGVRIGIDLDGVRAQQAAAGERLDSGIEAVGRRHLITGLVLLVTLLLLTVVVSLYVQRTLVQPVRSLVTAARRMEQGDYEVELPDAGSNDEIGELVRSFSTMSQAIARHDREVRKLAYTDALTGLSNRLAFRQALESRMVSASAAGQRLALLFVDVDDFKRVNDTLGHEAGDDVLLRFVERINAAVTSHGGSQSLLARFGGDEFVILLGEGDTAANALRLAEVLVAELSKPLSLSGRDVFLGSSIGITLFPDDAADATGLLKNGDIAMYQAKLAGKNCYRYYSRAMDHAVERRVHMEQELRGAWERGELHLVYQPIYRTRDRRLVGVEVLLRWQHPQLGAIPPSVFIQVAEQSGLIEQLGPKVLRAACMEARRWEAVAGGEQLFVSVNVSPRQLRNGDLSDVVVACLAESGLPASRLHIELTETAVIGDEMLAASLLDKLHRHGVKVWLDDFGTGFSGLSHLRQVPVDGVKIDKSFVADMQRDPDDLALTTAIIAMCHALGITVVAEGIEQEAQFDLLAQRSCDLVQGYWLGRPLSSTQLVQLLKTSP